MMTRLACAALICSGPCLAAPPAGTDAGMTILHKQDVTGQVLKKLGLPARSYCWNECLQNTECTAVRWGVLKGDTAGLCILFKGELKYRAPVKATTDDGTPILVTTAKKTLGRDVPRS